MEHESQIPQMGMLGCDRDLFARVWARAGGGTAGPVEVLPPPAPTRGSGPGQTEEGELTFLHNCIRKTLERWRVYQFLAARAGGQMARTLSAMAADERRHAQRLTGSCFLLTGVRIFPVPPPMQKGRTAFWPALRDCFWAEQHAAAAYAAAADQTQEPALAGLYRTLSAEESVHAERLRAMAEEIDAGF